MNKKLSYKQLQMKKSLDSSLKLLKEGKKTLFDFNDTTAFILERRLRREKNKR
jgi:hypothetical protein|tara:strand:+ start:2659 stop:2817 length:159 start_codon:yes stop_codon:yes gene_type:complete